MELYLNKGYAYGLLYQSDFRDYAHTHDLDWPLSEAFSGDALYELEKKLLCDTMDLAADSVFFLRQVHGNTVITITGEQPAVADQTTGIVAEGDALVTTLPITLVVRTADCLGLLGANPHYGIHLAVHAGWRGCANRVATQAVEQAWTLAGQPADKAEFVRGFDFSLGPHRRLDMYEVGEEFKDVFGPELLAERNGQLHFSMTQAIRAELRALGALPSQFRDIGWCTGRHHPLFFSHRADDRGRNLNFIQPVGPFN